MEWHTYSDKISWCVTGSLELSACHAFLALFRLIHFIFNPIYMLLPHTHALMHNIKVSPCITSLSLWEKKGEGGGWFGKFVTRIYPTPLLGHVCVSTLPPSTCKVLMWCMLFWQPSKKMQEDKSSLFVIFKNSQEAHQAYEKVKGSQEKVYTVIFFNLI